MSSLAVYSVHLMLLVLRRRNDRHV